MAGRVSMEPAEGRKFVFGKATTLAGVLHRKWMTGVTTTRTKNEGRLSDAFDGLVLEGDTFARLQDLVLSGWKSEDEAEAEEEEETGEDNDNKAHPDPRQFAF